MLLITVVLWALNLTVTRYILTHGFEPLAYATVRYGAATADLPRDRARRRADAADPPARLRPGRARGALPLAEPALVRLRAREDERVDDRADPRRDADLRGADRARASGSSGCRAASGSPPRSRSPASVSSRSGSSGGVSGDLRGDLLGIATAATWAGYSVAIAPLMQRYSASRISAVVLSLGWVLIALVGFPQAAEPGLRRRLEGLGAARLRDARAARADEPPLVPRRSTGSARRARRSSRTCSRSSPPSSRSCSSPSR